MQRARTLTALSRAPAQHVARHRARLHQQARELRASTARGLDTRGRRLGDDARRMERGSGAVVAAAARGATRVDADAKALDRAAAAARARRATELERLRIALDAHDPQRTLERGYALVEDAAGAPVTSAEAARAERELTLRLADGVAPRPPRPAAESRVAARGPVTDRPDVAVSSPAMTEGTLTYETACARIEAIVRRLDSGEAGLRETLELCQEGKRLVEFCAGELEAVGRGLEELQLDALVSRLEAGRAAG